MRFSFTMITSVSKYAKHACSPGVPAISTLNVRSMVLFSNGDPLWSLEDKKKGATFYLSGGTETL